MAIRVKYEPAAVGLALASDLTGRGQLAKERQKFREQQRQFEEQIAEQQRQFDTGQEFRGQEFDEGVRRFDLGFDEGGRQFNVNKWMDSQRLLEGQRQYNLSLQERYAKDRKDRQMAIFQQEEAGRRAAQAQQGAMARQGAQGQQAMAREQARSADNMQRWHQDRLATQMNSDWKSLQDRIRRLTPEQQTEAVEKFEEKYRNSGIPMPFAPPPTPPTPEEQQVAAINEQRGAAHYYVDEDGRITETDLGKHYNDLELEAARQGPKQRQREATTRAAGQKLSTDYNITSPNAIADIEAKRVAAHQRANVTATAAGGVQIPVLDEDGKPTGETTYGMAIYTDEGELKEFPNRAAYMEWVDGQKAEPEKKLAYLQNWEKFQNSKKEREIADAEAKRDTATAIRLAEDSVSQGIANDNAISVVGGSDEHIKSQVAEEAARYADDGIPMPTIGFIMDPTTKKPAKMFKTSDYLDQSAPPAAPPAAPAAGPPARPTAVPATTPAPAEEQGPPPRESGMRDFFKNPDMPRTNPTPAEIAWFDRQWEEAKKASERRRRPPKKRGGEKRYIKPLGQIADPKTGKPLKGRWLRLKENPTPAEIANFDRQVEEAKTQAGYSDDERERDLRKNIRPDRSRTEARRKRLEERDSLPFRGVSDTYRHLSREPGGRQIHRNIMPKTMGDILGGAYKSPYKKERGRPSTAEERMYSRMERQDSDPTFGRRKYSEAVQKVLGKRYPDEVVNRLMPIFDQGREVGVGQVPQRVRMTDLQKQFDDYRKANKEVFEGFDRWTKIQEFFDDHGIMHGMTAKEVYETAVGPLAEGTPGSDLPTRPRTDRFGREVHGDYSVGSALKAARPKGFQAIGRTKPGGSVLFVPEKLLKLKGKNRDKAIKEYREAIEDAIYLIPWLFGDENPLPGYQGRDPLRPLGPTTNWPHDQLQPLGPGGKFPLAPDPRGRR